MNKFQLIGIGLTIILNACHIHRTTRNPVFRKKCPVHDETLIKTRIQNEGGAWCEIYFDKKKNPYPKIGICNTCVSRQFESDIKYCPKCGNGHDTINVLNDSTLFDKQTILRNLEYPKKLIGTWEYKSTYGQLGWHSQKGHSRYENYSYKTLNFTTNHELVISDSSSTEKYFWDYVPKAIILFKTTEKDRSKLMRMELEFRIDKLSQSRLIIACPGNNSDQKNETILDLGCLVYYNRKK